jgi:hypothetical protein
MQSLHEYTSVNVLRNAGSISLVKGHHDVLVGSMMRGLGLRLASILPHCTDKLLAEALWSFAAIRCAYVDLKVHLRACCTHACMHGGPVGMPAWPWLYDHAVNRQPSLLLKPDIGPNARNTGKGTDAGCIWSHSGCMRPTPE